MSQPPVYNRQADFTSYQTNNPGQPMSGSDLDNEHNAEKLTLDAILTNMAIIQRDDTALANAVVHPDALNTATLALIAADWTPKGPWVTATDYVPGDVVETSGTSYVAVTAHTAGTFATDYAAGLWVVLGFGKGTIQSNAATFSIVGGTPDVMTAAFTPAIEALADGMELSVRAIGANTVTTPSINIDGLGAKTITRIGNDALVEGDIYGANHELIVRYNLSNDVFELLNPVPVGSALQQITTVAKLKTLSIKAGRTVSTQGFYAAGDGGGAEYHIVAPQAFDGYADHELANGNIAVLQHITAELDVRRCGVKVDGVTDDTVATQAAVDYVELTGAGTVYIP